MSYSCGYFKNESDTLYQAQCNKVERILEKLNLSEGMTLCDIGCGWGFLFIEAANDKMVLIICGKSIFISTNSSKTS